MPIPIVQLTNKTSGDIYPKTDAHGVNRNNSTVDADLTKLEDSTLMIDPNIIGEDNNDVELSLVDLQGELKVLQSRISRLIANENTSVDDQELQDIRIDINSIEHLSAGDAVRSQIINLTKSITNINKLNESELFNKDIAISGQAYQISTDTIEASLENGYVQIDVKFGDRIELCGLSQNITTFGYCIKDSTDKKIENGPESNNMTIIIPTGATTLIVTFLLTDIDAMSIIKRSKYTIDKVDDVIIIGDSWSDTDPTHTAYVKWPIHFNKWINCNLHNYAKNGSTIIGADNYAVDGTHGGQVATAILDNSYVHSNVSLIIFEGGLIDYRNGKTSAEVLLSLVSLINRLKAEFTNAKIVFIGNNQIFVSSDLWKFYQNLTKDVSRTLAIPAYHSIGWVKPTDYITDKTQLSNDGYKSFASNVISICNGGIPTFCKPSIDVPLTLTTGTGVLNITEIINNDTYEREVSLVISNTNNTTGIVEFSVDDNIGLISNAPFYSSPSLEIDDANILNIKLSIVNGTSPDSIVYNNKRPTTFTGKVGYNDIIGKYIGRSNIIK